MMSHFRANSNLENVSENNTLRICNRMGPRAINVSFHAYFQSSHKIAQVDNLENFENTSEINP